MKYQHKIPIHLEVEDRLVAGLSARQLLLIGSGLALGYLIWSSLARLHTTHWGLFVAALLSLQPIWLGIVAAFFQPASRGLEAWAMVAFAFLLQPKVYLWATLPDTLGKTSSIPLVSSDPLLEEEEN